MYVQYYVYTFFDKQNMNLLGRVSTYKFGSGENLISTVVLEADCRQWTVSTTDWFSNLPLPVGILADSRS